VALTKTEIIDSISKATGVAKSHTDKVINELFSTITKELKAGNKLTFIGFGSFNPVKRSARMGRNPQTGESIKIPASKSVHFSVGSALKDTLNGKAPAKKAPAKKAPAKKAPAKKSAARR
jgi:DNA-binding protein HU-beta